MVVWLIIALLAGLGAMFAIPSFLGQIGGGIGTGIIVIAQGIVYVMTLAMIPIMVLGPIYIMSRSKKIKQSYYVIGVIYGLILLFAATTFGFLTTAINGLSRITGSWWDTSVNAVFVVLLMVFEGIALCLMDFEIINYVRRQRFRRRQHSWRF
ncbi:MAG: hypothetical protein WED05_10040 [Candidatus Atabeyarchaeum deiterrae]